MFLYLLVVSGVVSVQAARVCPPTLAVAAAGKSVVAVRGRRGDLVPVTATCTGLESAAHKSEMVSKKSADYKGERTWTICRSGRKEERRNVNVWV